MSQEESNPDQALESKSEVSSFDDLEKMAESLLQDDEEGQTSENNNEKIDTSPEPEGEKLSSEAPEEDPEPDEYITLDNQVKKFDSCFEGATNEQKKVLKDLYERSDEATYLTRVANSITKISETKDFKSICEIFDISDDDLWTYARERLEFSNLPDEQRQFMADREKLDRDKRDFEHQMQQHNNQLAQQEINKLSFEWNQTLSRPEVSEFEQIFNEKLGEDAFRAEVRRYGLEMENNNKIVSIPEAVNFVISRYKKFMPEPEIKEEIPDSKPHFPKIKGSSHSPVRKNISSFEDLEREINNY